MKKLLAMLLAVAMVLSMAACGNSNEPADVPAATEGTAAPVAETYTYNTYLAALATNWNPVSWEMNADWDVLALLQTGLVDMTIADSEAGEYQWIFLAANDIIDVTAEHQDDLVKYNCVLPEGVSAEEVTESYVYEIVLNPEMCWEDGTPINADTYIYSMQQMLNPEMKNYRANNYYSGESALAGAEGYFYSGSTAAQDNSLTAAIASIDDLVKGEDGNYYTAEGGAVNIVLTTPTDWLGGSSLADYVGAYGADYFDVEAYASLEALADENGNVALNDETLPLIQAVISNPNWGEGPDYYVNYITYDQTFPVVEWDAVGLYKVDDYTIRYVCQTAYDYYYFLTSCTTNWLVYEELFEAGKDTSGTLVTTDYGTKPENTMSYGPYKLTSLQDAKQMVLERNENYFEYEVAEDGTLSSVTSFLVDGENVPQWLVEKYVINVMTDDAAKQAFMKGEVDDWAIPAEEVVNYSTSEQLYKVDEEYTMRLFFNCGLENLKTMDASYGNTNSVVLSNINFRKAMSLAINREEFVTATAGYKPAFSMIAPLYFYNVYEDPSSSYRASAPAMQAICNLYGVEYGEGTPYATLEEACASVNGYNLTEAKALMATACAELVAEGLYTEGDPIVIRMGYKAGTLDSTDNQQVALLNEYINAAAEGSGFGKITLEAVDNLSNRYASVANGEFAIGWGAWGGAAFYPFTMFRVYCDPDYVSPIHESGCYNPAVEEVTLNIGGEDITMTWQAWSNSMAGTGMFANESNDVKLEVLAALEQAFMEQYYCIPIATSTACSMLSYKLSNYTENYNIMYGFGGLRLTRFNYSDAEWTDFVASQGGTLSYE